VVLATAGQRHEAPLLPVLLDAGAVKRTGPDGCPGRGRPRQRSARLVADKGYSYPTVRAQLRRRGIAAVIPTRSDQRHQPGFDRHAYRQRNRVDWTVGRLKQFRRVATRYEKLAVNYLTWVTLATIAVLAMTGLRTRPRHRRQRRAARPAP
jgi:transposase